jgi:hypothetical protein
VATPLSTLTKPALKNPLEFQWIPMEKGLSTLGRPSQIYEALSIRKSTYYDRLKYLKSDPCKDAEGTYLNALANKTDGYARKWYI